MSILDELLSRFQTAIAATSAWQTWCNETAANAINRVHIHDADIDAPLPMATIEWSYDLELQSAYLTGDEAKVNGSMLVSFLAEFDHSVIESQAYFNYLGNCTDVMTELLGDASSLLPIHSARLIDGPTRTPIERRLIDGDHMHSLWSISSSGVWDVEPETGGLPL